MSTCPGCGAPLEWSPNGQQHARCTRCAGLYSGDGGSLTPVRLEAPGGGFNAEFQAIFEQQLGFAARRVPNQPPAYWGGGGGSGGGGDASPAPNAIQRAIQLSILAFVLLLLGGIGLYVGWIVWTTIPH
jgi:hypothetical protein